MGSTTEVERCIGCGAVVPKTDGPTHRYLGASPGCWAVYGEVLAKEYEDFRYAAVHQLTADSYAVQHPGEPSPQTIQSAAVHLISLCLTLERGWEPGRTVGAMQKVKATLGDDLAWLEPPDSPGDVTVIDVAEAADPAEHRERVQRWAHSVWGAWSAHHDTARRWVDRL